TKSFFNQEREYRLFLEPKGTLNPAILEVIANADIIVIGPGNLFSSLIPTLLVDNFGQIIKASKAKKIYICNLVTKPGQTDGFKVHDFVNKIAEYIGENWCDFVLYNTERPPVELLEKYAKKDEQWVEYDENILNTMRYTSLGIKLISEHIHIQDPNDKLITRTLIRHNAYKVSRAIMRVHYFDEE
ncbi:MAG: 2-phospho-L-lactate transferase CofD family protein, partial [Patescibacteria group bacterium]